MRRILVLLAVLLAPTFGWAQGQVADIFNDFELDALAWLYCDTTDVPALMTACATGVAATDGWIDTRGHSDKTVGIAIDQVNVVGGIDIRFEVRYVKEDGTFTSAIILMNLINKTTADTDNQSVRIPDEVAFFRIGMQIGTADDGAGDAGANAEDIDIIYNAR